MSDKTISLITGANAGIGYDTAYALAASSPNHHVIFSSRNPQKGDKALAKLRSKAPSGSFSYLQLDVTKDADITSAAKQIESEFGRLDILINNAGLVSILPDDHDQLRETFETNTFGPYLLTQALVPLLKKSKDPRIINVSSVLGSISRRVNPTAHSDTEPYDMYRMSKAALNMLSACQLGNYKQWGCKVWAFCPGYVVTNLSGEHDREARKARGGESSETSAKGILDIVEGKRDGEVGGFIEKNGGSYTW